MSRQLEENRKPLKSSELGIKRECFNKFNHITGKVGEGSGCRVVSKASPTNSPNWLTAWIKVVIMGMEGEKQNILQNQITELHNPECMLCIRHWGLKNKHEGSVRK